MASVVFISAIISAYAGSITKSITNDKYNPGAYTLIFAECASIMFFIIALFQIPTKISLDPIAWICFCGTGIIFSLSNIETFKAFETIDYSLCSIIYRVNIIVSVILSFFLFNDKLGSLNIIGIFLILLGSSVALYDGKKKNFLSIGAIHALASGVLVGIAVILNKYVLEVLPAAIVCIGNYLFQIPFVINKKTFKQSIDIAKTFSWQIILWTMMLPFSWGGYMFVLSRGNISVVQPVYQSVLLIAQVILGIIMLKENENISVKMVGLLLNIAGILFINI
ncbi:MAG: EamA family transporter [Ignavibacteriales bacterium]